jgi:hypothetical protein
MSSDNYPEERNLDGFFYRVERNGKFVNRCFSDLTDEEQPDFLSRIEKDGYIRMCKELSAILRRIGDQFGIMGRNE